MALRVLDTDHLSLLQRGHPSLLPRIQAATAAEIAISIISIEEMLQGRLAQVRRAGTSEDDAQAERRYTDLAARRLRVGTQDLKIAASTLIGNAPPSAKKTVPPLGA